MVGRTWTFTLKGRGVGPDGCSLAPSGFEGRTDSEGDMAGDDSIGPGEQ